MMDDDMFLFDETGDDMTMYNPYAPPAQEESPPTGVGIPWGWHRPHYDRRSKARKDEDILLF